MKTHLRNFPRRSSAATEKCAHSSGISVAPTCLDNSCSIKTNHLTLTPPQMEGNCHVCVGRLWGKAVKNGGVNNAAAKEAADVASASVKSALDGIFALKRTARL